MKLHADYSQRVLLHTPDLPWVESPMPGVHRLLVDTVDIQTRFGPTTAPYQSVSCTYYDELEALATLKRSCPIIYRSDTGAEVSCEGRIVDFFSVDKAEFLKLDDGTTIRLDHLIAVDGKPVRFSDS